MDEEHMNLFVAENGIVNDVEMMVKRQNDEIQDTLYKLNKDWFTQEQLTIAAGITSNGGNTYRSGLPEEKKTRFSESSLQVSVLGMWWQRGPFSEAM